MVLFRKKSGPLFMDHSAEQNFWLQYPKSFGKLGGTQLQTTTQSGSKTHFCFFYSVVCGETEPNLESVGKKKKARRVKTIVMLRLSVERL